jgi:hypothetical protein
MSQKISPQSSSLVHPMHTPAAGSQAGVAPPHSSGVVHAGPSPVSVPEESAGVPDDELPLEPSELPPPEPEPVSAVVGTSVLLASALLEPVVVPPEPVSVALPSSPQAAQGKRSEARMQVVRSGLMIMLSKANAG